MKSFLILVVGGALLLGAVGASLNVSGEPEGYLWLGGIGAFFGAKFGLIGWAILSGVRLIDKVL